MFRARSKFRIPKALFTTLTVLALAACGGGGGSGGGGGGGSGGGGDGGGGDGGGGTPTVAVDSVTLPAENGIAILGTQKTVPALVKGTDGSTLTDRTIAWTSSNPAVLTVEATGAQGIVNPVATGDAIVTATVEGQTATMKLYVRKEPSNLAEYKAMFPFVAQEGQFIVASDISQAYSDSRLDHLKKSWGFFEAFFPKKPGNHAEMYYTWDTSIVQDQAGAVCPTPALLADLPGRLLRTCFDPVLAINNFLAAPDLAASGTVDMDHATALSTLGQSFLDSITAADTYTWPWLWEGLSIAFKSGDFDDGTYTMRKLVDPDRTAFEQARTAGTLLPLTPNLVALTRVRGDPPTGDWYDNYQVGEPQSAMLLNYLFVSRRDVVQNLIAAIDAGFVTTSQQAFDYVLDPITGLDISDADLDAAYQDYGRNP